MSGPRGPRDLAGATWEEVDGGVLVVPLGSTEQHGPHLPLGTDTMIAEGVARAAADGRQGIWISPAVPVGSAGEHAGFPGTLSVGATVTQMLTLELLRSATPPGGGPFAAVVLVCAHGGNLEPVSAAVGEARREGRSVGLWVPRDAEGDAHAGVTETSVMLALHPTSVRRDRAVAGVRAPLSEVVDELRSRGVAGVSPSGVLGDPTGATAERGRELVDRWAGEVAALCDAFLSGGARR